MGVVIKSQDMKNAVNVSDQGSLIVRVDSKSAFGEVIAVPLSPIIQGTFEYTVDNTELFSQTTTGSGSITQNNSMAVVSTGTTTSSKASFQSHHEARYRSGMGALFRFTGLFTTGVSGTSQWIGLFDEEGSTSDFKNGYGIGYNGEEFGVVRFRDDETNFTALSDCDDRLDGSGESGMTLDPTKLNVFSIQYQYLGAGAINFMVEDDDTGEFVTFHTIDFTNKNDGPSVYNPNFYICFYANNKATTSDVTIKSASYAYFTEGRTRYEQIHQPEFSTERQNKTGVTSEVAAWTIKNKSTYAGKTNFIPIVIERLSLAIEASSSNNLAEWRLIKDTSLGGTPSYSDINTNNSVVEIDTSGTTVSGGKTLIAGDLAGKNDRSIEGFIDFNIILFPGESITLAVSSANSAEFNSSMLWKELF